MKNESHSSTKQAQIALIKAEAKKALEASMQPYNRIPMEESKAQVRRSLEGEPNFKDSKQRREESALRSSLRSFAA